MQLPENVIQQVILVSIFSNKETTPNLRLVNKFFKFTVDQNLYQLEPASLDLTRFQNASMQYANINSLNLQNLAFYESFQSLEGLNFFPNLQNLKLRWPALTQAQCNELGYLPNKLKYLNLELTGTIGSRQIFHPLTKLNSLIQLIIKIEDMFYLDDQNVYVFSLLLNLEEFSLLGQARMTTNALRILKTLKKLKKIQIESPLRGFSPITHQEWIEIFLNFPNLEEIALKSNWVGNDFLRALNEFEQIKFSSFKVDLASQWLMTLVGRLTHVHALEIGLDTTWQAPSDQPSISCMSHVNVTSCALWGILNPLEIRNLEQFKNLKNLMISCNNTSAAYLNILGKLTQLTKLGLTGTANHNLNFLTNLNQLKNLMIKAHSIIGMKDMHALRILTSLETLDLEGTMDSESLGVLGQIQNLKNLSLASNNLCHMDLTKPLQEICKKTSLKFLKIEKLKVSKNIVDSICVPNSNLQTIKLISCRVAEEDLTSGFLRIFLRKLMSLQRIRQIEVTFSTTSAQQSDVFSQANVKLVKQQMVEKFFGNQGNQAH